VVVQTQLTQPAGHDQLPKLVNSFKTTSGSASNHLTDMAPKSQLQASSAKREASVGKRGASVGKRVAGVAERVASVDERVASVDERVVGVDERVAGVYVDEVVDNKLLAVIDGAY
jgi:hypothetical protein